MQLSPTPRTTVRRGAVRARTERSDLYDVLDAGLICSLGVVVDGAPLVLPTCYGRDGDTLFLHGSTGALSLRSGTGAEVCVSVTLLDGVVYGRSVFHHSVNYRSAVVRGTAHLLTGTDERLHALRTLVEHLSPGQWDYAREPSPKELAATAVLALDLAEASVKVRTGPPGDEPEDVAAGAVWAGVLPVRQVWGEPESCPLLPPGMEAAPEHVKARRPSPAALRG